MEDRVNKTKKNTKKQTTDLQDIELECNRGSIKGAEHSGLIDPMYVKGYGSQNIQVFMCVNQSYLQLMSIKCLPLNIMFSKSMNQICKV